MQWNRIFFFILLTFFLSFATNGKIGISYKDAVKKNAKDGKPILLEFYAKWCIPCLEMEKTVFQNSAVLKELRTNFHFVRIDTEKEQELFCEGETLPIYGCMLLWEIDGIPTFAILDIDGKLQHIAVGDYGTDEFLAFLKAIKMSLNKGKAVH